MLGVLIKPVSLGVESRGKLVTIVFGSYERSPTRIPNRAELVRHFGGQMTLLGGRTISYRASRTNFPIAMIGETNAYTHKILPSGTR